VNFIDTHCHIHDLEFFNEVAAKQALKNAVNSGVQQIVCVATSLEDSKRAIAFAQANSDQCVATVGIHPHEAANLTLEQIASQLEELDALAEDEKVVAVGECGFDFYYNDKNELLQRQEALLRGQIEIARKYGLSLSFHVREAFDDFWRVFESYSGISGVLHSFTDRPVHLERAIKHGLSIGINGIASFTSHTWQRDMFKSIPLENILIETDAPFLTPHPKRGTINTPENVIYITNFLAELRGEEPSTIAKVTTANAQKLFNL